MQQKQRAEANFDKARRAVDEYLTQVTDNQLLSVPGLQSLRENLLSAALKFYAEFTQERADDPALQRELASAHFRLGRIHQELGQSGSAGKSNAEAIRLYERLRDAGHFDQDVHVALAKAYYYATRYEDTIKLCQNVLRAAPEHAETRSLLADSYNSLAIDAKNKTKSIDAALDYHRQAFELRQALVHDFGENSSYLAQLGGTLNNLGVLLDRQGKSEEAAAMFERGVAYAAQAYEKAPHSILWGRWLCIGLDNLARKQSALERKGDALASYKRLVVVSRKLAFENPAVTSLRGELYNAHLLLGRYQRQLGNTVEASRSFRDARDVLEHIPRETAQELYEAGDRLCGTAAAGGRHPEVEPARGRSRRPSAPPSRPGIAGSSQSCRRGFYRRRRRSKPTACSTHCAREPTFRNLSRRSTKAAQAQQLAARKEGPVDERLADRLKAAQLLSDVVNRATPSAVGYRNTPCGNASLDRQRDPDAEAVLEEAEASLRQRSSHGMRCDRRSPGSPELEVD